MTDGLQPPSLASVVALLYRADWTRLSLSGQARGSDEAQSPVATGAEMVRTMPSSGPVTAADPAAADTLRVAPGGRYRRDGALASAGSDGTRAWQRPPGPRAQDAAPPGPAVPPFATLLCPSWLLTGYSLTVEDRVTACGRDAIRVTGIARRGGRPRPAESRLPGRPRSACGTSGSRPSSTRSLASCCAVSWPTSREAAIRAAGWPSSRALTRALVATTRCSPRRPAAGHGTRRAAPPIPVAAPSALAFLATYFPGLTGPAARAASRRRGSGRASVPGVRPPGVLTPGTASRCPTTGRHSTRRRCWPSRCEDSVSEDVLALLYRSGTGVPRFTATSHFWANGAGIIAGTDAIARADDTTTHQVSRVRIDGWSRYRIERAPPAPGASIGAARAGAVAAGVQRGEVLGGAPGPGEHRRPATGPAGDSPTSRTRRGSSGASCGAACRSPSTGGRPTGCRFAAGTRSRSCWRSACRRSRRWTRRPAACCGSPATAAGSPRCGGSCAMSWRLTRSRTRAGRPGGGDFEFTVPAGRGSCGSAPTTTGRSLAVAGRAHVPI